MPPFQGLNAHLTFYPRPSHSKLFFCRGWNMTPLQGFPIHLRIQKAVPNVRKLGIEKNTDNFRKQTFKKSDNYAALSGLRCTSYILSPAVAQQAAFLPGPEYDAPSGLPSTFPFNPGHRTAGCAFAGAGI